jgi:hypothetical protein
MKLIYSSLSHLLKEIKLRLLEQLLRHLMSLVQRYVTDALASLPDAIASPIQRSLPS